MTTYRTIRQLLAAALFLAASIAAAAPVTDVRLQNTGAVAQTAVPITFGQVFAVGDVKKSDVLIGSLAGAAVPLQVDVKATHADGSVRHAVISAIAPKLPVGTTALSIATGGPASSAATANFRDAGATANVTLTIAGVKYTASLADALASTPAPWLAGPIAAEVVVDAPLKTAAGAVHPLLSVHYGVRWYPGAKATRVDVSVENTWAYEPNPQNVTYDVAVEVGGKTVYSKAALTHFHHARWRKVFWIGAEPAVHVQHNTAYLIASRALPNYDQSIVFPESTLAGLGAQYAADSQPMGLGLSMAYMPTTGGRADIGLLPGWAATYLLTMDKRAKDVTLGTAELAGTYSSHYRDKDTGRPLSLIDYPYTSINDPNDGDTKNPVTGKLEALPKPLAGKSENQAIWDVAHQPAYAYLPYMVTGDFYFLEELQFWAMANAINGHPGYRDGAKGLVSAEQTRGQAWALRTLAEAAYITPDNDRFKGQFTAILDSNLSSFVAQYSDNPQANALGIIDSTGYQNLAGVWGTAVAPWQDDFFTSAMGHAAELGFSKAADMLKWKAKFPIQRMVGAGACWLDAAIYNLVVRDTPSSPIYADIGTGYRASHTAEFNALACNSAPMAAAFGLKVGEMNGYASSPGGLPSNMQPALAYAVDSGAAQGAAAWALFASRPVKPDYSSAPSFAIVPRGDAVAPVIAPPLPPVATPPPAKPGTITTPSTVTVAKLKCLTYRVFILATLATVSDFACITPTSANKFTLSGASLTPGASGLAGAVIDPVTGVALTVQYPLTVK